MGQSQTLYLLEQERECIEGPERSRLLKNVEIASLNGLRDEKEDQGATLNLLVEFLRHCHSESISCDHLSGLCDGKSVTPCHHSRNKLTNSYRNNHGVVSLLLVKAFQQISCLKRLELGLGTHFSFLEAWLAKPLNNSSLLPSASCSCSTITHLCLSEQSMVSFCSATSRQDALTRALRNATSLQDLHLCYFNLSLSNVHHISSPFKIVAN